MKRVFIAGIIIVLAAFFVTCEADLPEELGGEYTDVVYNVDAKGALNSVTLYLDGKGVPRSASQRAITTDLAKMAYDYFEVLFVGPTPAGQKIARAVWELGQPAGISGVQRTLGATDGIDYKFTAGATPAPSATVGIASMFVGRKDNKTLLGVGRIGDVDKKATGLADATYPTVPATTIKSDSTSVTFWIEAIKTGLLVGAETVWSSGTPTGNVNTYEIQTTSFALTTCDALVTASGTNWAGWSAANPSVRMTIGGVDYPMYKLPQKKEFAASTDTTTTGAYEFKGAAATSSDVYGAIKVNALLGNGIILKRFPRYMDSGRYYQPKSNIDSDTTITTTLATTAGTTFVPTVPLIFSSKNTGIFSFYLEIPVYMLLKTGADGTTNKPTNGGPDATIWKIRTGIGADLYSLDSGKSAGGCVLISIGVASLDDWLDIDWEWVK